MAFLEMAREQREADQQTKEVREDDPFVGEVRNETRQTRPRLEAGEGNLVDDDRRQTRERDPQGVVMKQGHAKQRQPKENKLERDAEHARLVLARFVRPFGGRAQKTDVRPDRRPPNNGQRDQHEDPATGVHYLLSPGNSRRPSRSIPAARHLRSPIATITISSTTTAPIIINVQRATGLPANSPNFFRRS